MWSKPGIKKADFEVGNLSEMTEQEMMESAGGIKVGVCFAVGIGGDWNTGKTGFPGFCYIVGL